MRRDRHRVGAERERRGRHVGVEAEVAGPGLVADQRDAARVRELGDAGDVRDDAEPGRLDEQDGARVRLGLERGLDRLDGWPSATPRASSTAGATQTGREPESTSPAATDLCEQRETITGSPSEATARQSAWLGCVEPLPEKRQRSAPKAARGEPLGARADALAAAQVVGTAVHRRVVREQRVVADQRRVALVARASRTPSAPRAGTRRPRRRRESRGASRRETLCELCEAEQQHGLAVHDLAALDHGDRLG